MKATKNIILASAALTTLALLVWRKIAKKENKYNPDGRRTLHLRCKYL
jgi:hypothetical protein